MLVLSFLALGALWKRPQLERRAAGKPLPPALEGFLRSRALRVLLGFVSAGLLTLVFLTALIGEPSSAQNLAPTFIYGSSGSASCRCSCCSATSGRPEPMARIRERRLLAVGEVGQVVAAARLS